MLRITRRNRKQISPRLAIFAGLMLVVSSLAGMHQANQHYRITPERLVESGVETLEQNVANNVAERKISKKKGFKVSLFLFRLD